MRDVHVIGPTTHAQFIDSHNSTDVLDVVVTSKIDRFMVVVLIKEGSSDNSPLLITK